MKIFQFVNVTLSVPHIKPKFPKRKKKSKPLLVQQPTAKRAALVFMEMIFNHVLYNPVRAQIRIQRQNGKIVSFTIFRKRILRQGKAYYISTILK
jgi:hypothetical protein